MNFLAKGCCFVLIVIAGVITGYGLRKLANSIVLGDLREKQAELQKSKQTQK